MNKSTEFFDTKLDKIEHYQKFPSMRPFIGENYGKYNSRKIMLVAESHYLPPKSTISQNPENWYNSKQTDLSKEEIAWINTRGILSGDWKPNGHMIFRELNTRMSDFMDVKEFRAMTNVAFMNGFQRPAPETGDSIKKFCKPIDYKIGAQTINAVINIIEPDLVIFVSKLSWDELRWKIPKSELRVKYDFVCHPGTGGRYWHNKNYEHGMKKFKSLIESEVNTNV
ncbi:hypothetical protein D1013_09015 [Euzebyella marina]|uniref:Uracil-DNA glycosylase-like domain-containing protein n=1 Tax=Euzebyella marina TaxID=1761453 RepID=A0A3G2L5F7_9FLAO|nr:hypothetical protein [Euzebyella marina]AYN67492.1 hypothetical protein D1013_09015 [Euzebyella marina]